MKQPAPLRALLSCVALTSLLLVGCAEKKSHAALTPPAGQWVSLFNGKNLDGWTVKIAGLAVNDNYRNTFRVRDGLLTVSYRDYDTFGDRFGSLFHQTKVSRYWLRAEYRFIGAQARGAPSWAYKNSGIQLHSQSPDSMRREQLFPVSVEFDLVGGRVLGHHPTGDVCQNGTRVLIEGAPLQRQCSTLSDVTIDGEEWVNVVAAVDGSARVRQAVNGALVIDYTDLTLDERDPDAQRLLAAGADKALSAGYISIQANSHPIEFRRIDILPMAP